MFKKKRCIQEKANLRARMIELCNLIVAPILPFKELNKNLRNQPHNGDTCLPLRLLQWHQSDVVLGQRVLDIPMGCGTLAGRLSSWLPQTEPAEPGRSLGPVLGCLL